MFVKSHQGLDKSVKKQIVEYNLDDVIGRTFILPANSKSERHRASIKQNVIEVSEKLDSDQNTEVDKVSFHLDIGYGRSQTIISYNQVLNLLRRQIRKMTPSTSSELSQTTMDH